MNRWGWRFLRLVFSASLLWPLLSFAQDPPTPQDDSAKPSSTKEVKKRHKKLMKELGRDRHQLALERSSGHHH